MSRTRSIPARTEDSASGHAGWLPLLLVFLAVAGGGSRLAAVPAIDPVANVSVPVGKSVEVPVTGSTQNGWPLRYAASSSNPAFQVRVHTGNPTLRMEVADFGEMTFELFRDIAPITVGYIQGMVQSGFYDGLKFHRVVSNFVIQGGDPAGTGAGGPEFRFEDEFHPGTIFSGNGQLAMANSGKDSNGSQFFITIGAQRFLDFNHTIFGQLVRGFDVVSRIAAVPVNASSAPLTPVIIRRAGIVPNLADAVLSVGTVPGATGSALITVTADDGHGGVVTRTFEARAVADTTDDPPILGAVTNRVTAVNTPVVFNLSATDIENHKLQFAAQFLGGAERFATFTVVSNKVTVTPANNFVGALVLAVGVKQEGATSRGSTQNPYDSQIIVVGVGTVPILATGARFEARAGEPFTDQLLATFTSAQPGIVATNFNVVINWGDGTSDGGRVERRADGGFAVFGSHTYRQAGLHRLSLEIADTWGATSYPESQVDLPPALRVARAAGGQTLTWPGWATDFRLESAPVLPGTGAWAPMEAYPIPVGFDQVLTVPADGAERSFQLRAP